MIDAIVNVIVDVTIEVIVWVIDSDYSVVDHSGNRA